MNLTPNQKKLLEKERVFTQLAKKLPPKHWLQERLKAAAEDMTREAFKEGK